MFNTRNKLQTSSDSRRILKYCLAISKPKILNETINIKNASSEVNSSFSNFFHKNNMSLKMLNSHRVTLKKEKRTFTLENDLAITIKSKNDTVQKGRYCISIYCNEKKIDLRTNCETVKQLNLEIKQSLAAHSLNQNIKCVMSTNSNIALDYLLSLPQTKLDSLFCKKIKVKPYYGIQDSEICLQNFQIIQAIGCGGFSKVFLVRYKYDGKFYAMKTISKSFIIKNKKQRLVLNQKDVMVQVTHPFLANLYWTFQSTDHIIFVMDYYPGGQLFGLIKKMRRMGEGMAKFYIVEILLGLEKLHEMGIVYRDFKPENILLDSLGHACISDFGLVKPNMKDLRRKTFSFCGSPQYMPPQIVAKRGHSLTADFYSLGALLFQLVTGLPPFYNTNPNIIYQGTLNEQVSMPAYLSQNLKDLLSRLLCKSEDMRLGAREGVKQILSHQWFDKIDKSQFLDKKMTPPVSFTNLTNLTFNIEEMKSQNEELVRILKNQQLNQKAISLLLPDFYFNRNQKTNNFHWSQDEKSKRHKNNGKPHFALKKGKLLFTNASLEKIKKLNNFL